MYWDECCEIEDLKYKVLKKIMLSKDNDELIFITKDNERYTFYHEQDCCEYVTVDDVCGDFNDLLDVPLLEVEEVTNTDFEECDESCTWTFYKFGTIKGSVTVRWYGTSNGYYSESVSLRKE